MSLINFIEQFPDEESCKKKFKEYRDHVGVVCPNCGGTDHYWKKDKEQYECKACKKRTTLKSGTVMHKSKLPFRYWFITMHLLTSTKKAFQPKKYSGNWDINVTTQYGTWYTNCVKLWAKEMVNMC